MSYERSKIYKIESHLGDKIYIGSTTKRYLSSRMDNHRRDYKRWKDGLRAPCCKSSVLFDEYGVENCKIILIETFPCSSKDELNAKEAHYIRTLSCVNKIIPGRTQKQYMEEHHEYFSNRSKELIECECGRSVRRNHIARHKTTDIHKEIMLTKQ